MERRMERRMEHRRAGSLSSEKSTDDSLLGSDKISLAGHTCICSTKYCEARKTYLLSV